VAQVRGLVGLQLGPALAAAVHAVLGAGHAVAAGLLLMALELDHGGEQRPGAAVDQPHQALAA
jgi:hypothetical protein